MLTVFLLTLKWGSLTTSLDMPLPDTEATDYGSTPCYPLEGRLEVVYDVTVVRIIRPVTQYVVTTEPSLVVPPTTEPIRFLRSLRRT